MAEFTGQRTPSTPAMTDPSIDGTGTINIDDYVIGDVLGVGTVGTIYRAIRKSDALQVAVKRLHPAISRDATISARFEREMLILRRLQHPNIIRYFGGGRHEGELFYVMELVDGGTVKDLIESRRRIAWPVVVELTRQICSALQCAHNHGVIHRDLKPGNLFLTRSGELKLGDFGIARDQTLTDLTGTGMTVGTHAYMAPEQITGDSTITGKADLYALGCCLYEMLVGRKVFEGVHFAQLFESHLRKTPPRVRDEVPEVPEALDNIVFDLLAKDPYDRPFNARMVQGVAIELETKRKSGELRYGDASPGDANRRGGSGVGGSGIGGSTSGESVGGEPVAGDASAEISKAGELSVRESNDGTDGTAGNSVDVAADRVPDAAEMLRQSIEKRFVGVERPPIAWGRLAAVLIVMMIILIAATWLSNR